MKETNYIYNPKENVIIKIDNILKELRSLSEICYKQEVSASIRKLSDLKRMIKEGFYTDYKISV